MRHGLVAHTPDTSGVAVCGELNVATASTLSGSLLPLVARGGLIFVDVAHLVFIDAAGISPR